MLNSSTEGWRPSSSTPRWVYNDNYWYWTGSQKDDSGSTVWTVYHGAFLGSGFVSTPVSYSSSGISGGFVRPVIVLPKSEL